MKKLYTKTLIASACVLTLSTALFTFNSCGTSKTEKEVVSAGANEGFRIPELLERDKDLSYEEFTKIREKFNKLSSAYNANNGDFDNLVKLAEIYIYEARVTGEHPYYYGAALKTLDELIAQKASLTPDQHFTALFYKSTVQLSQHKFNDALVTGKQALAINNPNSGIYGVLVDANVEIGNYSEAVKYCDKMMSIRPDLRSYSRISYLREIYGDVPGSRQSMKLAINAGAPYSEYKCWTIVTMGKLYEDNNMLDSAAAYYQFATEERENYPFGIAGLASVAAKRGDYAKADSLYAKALKVLPEISFSIARAKIYQKQGRTEEMNKMVAEIETMFKEDIASGHNMNLEYAQFLNDFRHDYTKALTLAKEEYKKRPNNIDVNRVLAFTYYAKGDYANASRHADIAMKTNKQDADLYCIAGLAKKDAKLIKKSFKLDMYQDHLFAERAKQMVNA